MLGRFLYEIARKTWRGREKSTRENSKESSGDGSPKLQISVPCRGRTRPENTWTTFSRDCQEIFWWFCSCVIFLIHIKQQAPKTHKQLLGPCPIRGRKKDNKLNFLWPKMGRLGPLFGPKIPLKEFVWVLFCVLSQEMNTTFLWGPRSRFWVGCKRFKDFISLPNLQILGKEGKTLKTAKNLGRTFTRLTWARSWEPSRSPRKPKN